MMLPWTSALLSLTALTSTLALPLLAPAEPGLQEEEPLRRRHPQTNLLFDLPEDFEVAIDWRGYQRLMTESSILISESDERPLDVLKRGFFDRNQLARMGRKVVSREDCTLNGLPGIKVELDSEREGRGSKSWAVLFGDEDGSCMVLGTVFDDQMDVDGELVRHAVQTVVWDRPEKVDPFDHVDFTLDLKVLRILKYAAKDEGMVMFTFGGNVDTTDNPGRPCLEIRKVNTKVATKEEREALVRAQLAEAPNLKDFEITELKEIEIDGLKGIEGWAKGISTTHRDLNNNEMAVTVLQVTLFEDDAYYSMSGIIATIISKNWLQMYQAGIHSFARKKPAAGENAAKEEEEPKPEETPDEKKGGEEPPKKKE